MNRICSVIMDPKSRVRNVVVVGDGMTDVYVRGTAEKTCQEDCPKFMKEGTTVVPGGAANAARSLKYWTQASVHYFGATNGPVKTRFLLGERCVFRYDDEKSYVDTQSARMDALQFLNSTKQTIDAVLLSDYNKGMLTPEFIQRVASVCLDLYVPCVVDAKREPDVYRGCIIKGNATWSHKYKPNMLTPSMVITNGWDRPTVEGRPIPVNLSRVPCVNHVGAGDCFAAHLVLGLACRLSLEDAVALGYSAGRVYVQHPNNRPPRPEEVAADMDAMLTQQS